MKHNNNYQLLTSAQSDPRQELVIGNKIWIKVLLEMLGGFGNGYILRLIPILIGVLLGVSLFLTPAGWLPALIIGLSIGAGAIFGLFYGWDQYKISSKKNKKELDLIIINQEWNTHSAQIDRLLHLSNDGYLLITDIQPYIPELREYINERKIAERLNRELKPQVEQLELKYRSLTGNSILAFNKALPQPAAYITYPAKNNYSLPKKQAPEDESWWQKIKNCCSGFKQGLNYVGIPAGLMLATITTFLAAASTVTPLGIILFTGILAISAVVGAFAIFYQLNYEYPQEKKMAQLKQANHYLKKKCRIQRHQLQDQLNYIHFQNQHLTNHLHQLSIEISKIQLKPHVLASGKIVGSNEGFPKSKRIAYPGDARANMDIPHQAPTLGYGIGLVNS